MERGGKNVADMNLDSGVAKIYLQEEDQHENINETDKKK